MKSEIAIVGLAVGALGVLMAVAIKARWARPFGAVLLAVAVIAEILAIQAHTGANASGGGAKTLSPLPASVSTGSPSTKPTSTASPTLVVPLQLISQVHPGTEPIVKLITVDKEFVRLTNKGTIARHVGGWTLSNGTLTFTFPPGVTIPPNNSIVLKSGPGTNSATIFHWNLTAYAWPLKGGHITLRDGQGRLVDQCTYPVITPQDILAGNVAQSC